MRTSRQDLGVLSSKSEMDDIIELWLYPAIKIILYTPTVIIYSSREVFKHFLLPVLSFPGGGILFGPQFWEEYTCDGSRKVLENIPDSSIHSKDSSTKHIQFYL